MKSNISLYYRVTTYNEHSQSVTLQITGPVIPLSPTSPWYTTALPKLNHLMCKLHSHIVHLAKGMGNPSTKTERGKDHVQLRHNTLPHLTKTPPCQ